MDTDDEPVSTEITKSIEGNDIHHIRKSQVHQECTGEHCNFTQDDIRWIEESHSFVSNGTASPTNDLRLVSGSTTQHERKHLQPQKCSLCSYERTIDSWKAEYHSYTQNITESAASSYRQISGNASQHQRKYIKKSECYCGVKKQEDVWKNEGHTYEQKGETHGNCVTPTVKGYQCKYCSMTKTETGEKDLSIHNYAAATCTKPKTCTRCGQK